MAEWIGRELERLRKRRGLRREDVAAQVSLSPSTIRNIEHDEQYNVSLDVLRRIAEVLGATVNVTLELTQELQDRDGATGVSPPVSNSVADPALDPRKTVTNEYFIRLVRDRFPDCPLTNSQIGRRMWQFAKSRGAELVKERKQLRRVQAPTTATYRVPTSAAEYTVLERDIPALERFAERLGRAFKDPKGRVLVPIR